MVLAQSRKVSLWMYVLSLFVRETDMLPFGSLLNGRSWLLWASNKLWKQQLPWHSKNGGGTHNLSGDRDRKTRAGMHPKRAARPCTGRPVASWPEGLLTRCVTHPDFQQEVASWLTDGVGEGAWDLYAESKITINGIKTIDDDDNDTITTTNRRGSMLQLHSSAG
jgi:hypothetical protein